MWICIAPVVNGMTNYPIGPHRTQSGPHRDPIGPHRTPSHSTSYFRPPTTGQSFILALACTLQTRSIIDIQEKLPISTQLRRIPLKPTRCSYQRYAPTAQSSDIFEQLWTYDQHWVHLITALIVADRRRVDLKAFNWRCRLPWTVCKINLIWLIDWLMLLLRPPCAEYHLSPKTIWFLNVDRHASCPKCNVNR